MGVSKHEVVIAAKQDEHKKIVRKLAAEKEDLSKVLDDFLDEIRFVEAGRKRVNSISQELGMQDKVELCLDSTTSTRRSPPRHSTAAVVYGASTAEGRSKEQEMEAARTLLFEFKKVWYRYQ